MANSKMFAGRVPRGRGGHGRIEGWALDDGLVGTECWLLQGQGANLVGE